MECSAVILLQSRECGEEADDNKQCLTFSDSIPTTDFSKKKKIYIYIYTPKTGYEYSYNLTYITNPNDNEVDCTNSKQKLKMSLVQLFDTVFF